MPFISKKRSAKQTQLFLENFRQKWTIWDGCKINQHGRSCGFLISGLITACMNVEWMMRIWDAVSTHAIINACYFFIFFCNPLLYSTMQTKNNWNILDSRAVHQIVLHWLWSCICSFTFRVLTLWFDYGHWPEVNEALVEGIKTIQIDTWLQVRPFPAVYT